MTSAAPFPSEAFRLPPLAGLIAAGQPVFAVAAAGTAWAGEGVWANPAGRALLRATADAPLATALSASTDPALRQLARLAARMQHGAAPQLQKMRLSGAGAAGAIVTLRCWRIEGDPALFVVAALDAPQTLCIPPDTALSSDQSGSDQLMAPASDAQTPASIPGAAPVAADQASSVEPAPPARAGNVRFLWRSDAAGRLTALDGALCEVMGCDTGALIGRTFDDLISQLPLEPSVPLKAALSRRDTWSRIEIMWPFAGEPKYAPVTMGGLPSFDRAGLFDGYTGFGVIHLDAVADRPIAGGAVEPSLAESAVFDGTGETEDAGDGLAAAPASGGRAAADPEGPTQATSAPSGEPVQPASNVVPLRARQRDTQAPGQQHDETSTPTGDKALREESPAGQSANETDAGVAREDSSAGDTARKEDIDAIRQDMLAAASAADDGESPRDGKNDDTPDTGAPKSDAAANGDGDSREVSGIEGKIRQDDSGFRFNVPKADPDGTIELSPAERSAFREIARALGARSGNKPAAAGAETSGIAAGSGPLTPSAIAAAIAAGRAPAADETSHPPQDAAPGPAGKPVAEPESAAATGTGNREATVAALMERIGVDVLVLQDGKAVYANRTLLSTLGYADFDAFQQGGGVDRMFRGRDPEMLARDAAGGALPVVTSGGDIVTLDGRLQSASWQGKPATLLTLQENTVHESEAKLRALELEVRRRESEARELNAILDTATDGVVLLDEGGRILSLNGSAQALFGYDQNEVAGELLTILLARESHKAAMDYLDGLKSNGVRSVLNDGREVTGRAHKGGAIPLFMTIGRIASSPEQRFCAVLRDVTQWKKAERELSDARREAERTSSLKSDFLAKISHEVRTPLNAILGFAEVIMEERFGPVGNERYKDYLKDIHASGTHVLSLINDLLDLSKIEAGKLDLEFGSVDVSKVVNECVSIMQSQAIRERVIIRQSLAPRLPNVVADERSLRQIVLNILSNAVKFNEPGGQVIVSTALTDAGSAVIRIRDTGIGMSDAEVEMALEPFRQIATSRRSGGTGLGLPLTKALVEANRASFTIKSKRDEGTLVEVAFPPTRVLAE